MSDNKIQQSGLSGMKPIAKILDDIVNEVEEPPQRAAEKISYLLQPLATLRDVQIPFEQVVLKPYVNIQVTVDVRPPSEGFPGNSFEINLLSLVSHDSRAKFVVNLPSEDGVLFIHLKDDFPTGNTMHHAALQMAVVAMVDLFGTE